MLIFIILSFQLIIIQFLSHKLDHNPDLTHLKLMEKKPIKFETVKQNTNHNIHDN